MSLGTSAAPDSSATQTSTTKTNEERARDPKDTGPIDAEVTEETKTPRPPRVARVADVKPLNASEVFGGPVNETSNARAPRGEANGAQSGPKKGRKGKVAQGGAPEVTDKHQETAVGMLVMLDMLTRQWAASHYEDVLEPASLKDLDQRLKLTDAQIDGMSEPLARGLAENGVELPWWAQLGLAGAGVYASKLGTLTQLEKLKKEHDKSEAAKEVKTS